MGFGTLLVYFQGEWGTVCDNGFAHKTADVACQSIGWIRAEKVSFLYRKIITWALG